MSINLQTYQFSNSDTLNGAFAPPNEMMKLLFEAFIHLPVNRRKPITIPDTIFFNGTDRPELWIYTDIDGIPKKRSSKYLELEEFRQHFSLSEVVWDARPCAVGFSISNGTLIHRLILSGELARNSLEIANQCFCVQRLTHGTLTFPSVHNDFDLMVCSRQYHPMGELPSPHIIVSQALDLSALSAKCIVKARRSMGSRLRTRGGSAEAQSIKASSKEDKLLVGDLSEFQGAPENYGHALTDINLDVENCFHAGVVYRVGYVSSVDTFKRIKLLGKRAAILHEMGLQGIDKQKLSELGDDLIRHRFPELFRIEQQLMELIPNYMSLLKKSSPSCNLGNDPSSTSSLLESGPQFFLYKWGAEDSHGTALPPIASVSPANLKLHAELRENFLYSKYAEIALKEGGSLPTSAHFVQQPNKDIFPDYNALLSPNDNPKGHKNSINPNKTERRTTSTSKNNTSSPTVAINTAVKASNIRLGTFLPCKDAAVAEKLFELSKSIIFCVNEYLTAISKQLRAGEAAGSVIPEFIQMQQSAFMRQDPIDSSSASISSSSRPLHLETAFFDFSPLLNAKDGCIPTMLGCQPSGQKVVPSLLRLIQISGVSVATFSFHNASSNFTPGQMHVSSSSGISLHPHRPINSIPASILNNTSAQMDKSCTFQPRLLLIDGRISQCAGDFCFSTTTLNLDRPVVGANDGLLTRWGRIIGTVEQFLESEANNISGERSNNKGDVLNFANATAFAISPGSIVIARLERGLPLNIGTTRKLLAKSSQSVCARCFATYNKLSQLRASGILRKRLPGITIGSEQNVEITQSSVSMLLKQAQNMISMVSAGTSKLKPHQNREVINADPSTHDKKITNSPKDVMVKTLKSVRKALKKSEHQDSSLPLSPTFHKLKSSSNITPRTALKSPNETPTKNYSISPKVASSELMKALGVELPPKLSREAYIQLAINEKPIETHVQGLISAGAAQITHTSAFNNERRWKSEERQKFTRSVSGVLIDGEIIRLEPGGNITIEPAAPVSISSGGIMLNFRGNSLDPIGVELVIALRTALIDFASEGVQGRQIPVDVMGMDGVSRIFGGSFLVSKDFEISPIEIAARTCILALLEGKSGRLIFSKGNFSRFVAAQLRFRRRDIKRMKNASRIIGNPQNSIILDEFDLYTKARNKAVEEKKNVLKKIREAKNNSRISRLSSSPGNDISRGGNSADEMMAILSDLHDSQTDSIFDSNFSDDDMESNSTSLASLNQTERATHEKGIQNKKSGDKYKDKHDRRRNSASTIEVWNPNGVSFSSSSSNPSSPYLIANDNEDGALKNHSMKHPPVKDFISPHIETSNYNSDDEITSSMVKEHNMHGDLINHPSRVSTIARFNDTITFKDISCRKNNIFDDTPYTDTDNACTDKAESQINVSDNQSNSTFQLKRRRSVVLSLPSSDNEEAILSSKPDRVIIQAPNPIKSNLYNQQLNSPAMNRAYSSSSIRSKAPPPIEIKTSPLPNQMPNGIHNISNSSGKRLSLLTAAWASSPRSPGARLLSPEEFMPPGFTPLSPLLEGQAELFLLKTVRCASSGASLSYSLFKNLKLKSLLQTNSKNLHSSGLDKSLIRKSISNTNLSLNQFTMNSVSSDVLSPSKQSSAQPQHFSNTLTNNESHEYTRRPVNAIVNAIREHIKNKKHQQQDDGNNNNKNNNTDEQNYKEMASIQQLKSNENQHINNIHFSSQTAIPSNQINSQIQHFNDFFFNGKSVNISPPLSPIHRNSIDVNGPPPTNPISKEAPLSSSFPLESSANWQSARRVRGRLHVLMRRQLSLLLHLRGSWTSRGWTSVDILRSSLNAAMEAAAAHYAYIKDVEDRRLKPGNGSASTPDETKKRKSLRNLVRKDSMAALTAAAIQSAQSLTGPYGLNASSQQKLTGETTVSEDPYTQSSRISVAASVEDVFHMRNTKHILGNAPPHTFNKSSSAVRKPSLGSRTKAAVLAAAALNSKLPNFFSEDEHKEEQMANADIARQIKYRSKLHLKRKMSLGDHLNRSPSMKKEFVKRSTTASTTSTWYNGDDTEGEEDLEWCAVAEDSESRVREEALRAVAHARVMQRWKVFTEILLKEKIISKQALQRWISAVASGTLFLRNTGGDIIVAGRDANGFKSVAEAAQDSFLHENRLILNGAQGLNPITSMTSPTRLFSTDGSNFVPTLNNNNNNETAQLIPLLPSNLNRSTASGPAFEHIPTSLLLRRSNLLVTAFNSSNSPSLTLSPTIESFNSPLVVRSSLQVSSIGGVALATDGRSALPGSPTRLQSAAVATARRASVLSMRDGVSPAPLIPNSPWRSVTPTKLFFDVHNSPTRSEVLNDFGLNLSVQRHSIMNNFDFVPSQSNNHLNHSFASPNSLSPEFHSLPMSTTQQVHNPDDLTAAHIRDISKLRSKFTFASNLHARLAALEVSEAIDACVDFYRSDVSMTNGFDLRQGQKLRSGDYNGFNICGRSLLDDALEMENDTNRSSNEIKKGLLRTASMLLEWSGEALQTAKRAHRESMEKREKKFREKLLKQKLEMEKKERMRQKRSVRRNNMFGVSLRGRASQRQREEDGDFFDEVQSVAQSVASSRNNLSVAGTTDDGMSVYSAASKASTAIQGGKKQYRSFTDFDSSDAPSHWSSSLSSNAGDEQDENDMLNSLAESSNLMGSTSSRHNAFAGDNKEEDDVSAPRMNRLAMAAASEKFSGSANKSQSVDGDDDGEEKTNNRDMKKRRAQRRSGWLEAMRECYKLKELNEAMNRIRREGGSHSRVSSLNHSLEADFFEINDGVGSVCKDSSDYGSESILKDAKVAEKDFQRQLRRESIIKLKRNSAAADARNGDGDLLTSSDEARESDSESFNRSNSESSSPKKNWFDRIGDPIEAQSKNNEYSNNDDIGNNIYPNAWQSRRNSFDNDSNKFNFTDVNYDHPAFNSINNIDDEDELLLYGKSNTNKNYWSTKKGYRKTVKRLNKSWENEMLDSSFNSNSESNSNSSSSFSMNDNDDEKNSEDDDMSSSSSVLDPFRQLEDLPPFKSILQPIKDEMNVYAGDDINDEADDFVGEGKAQADVTESKTGNEKFKKKKKLTALDLQLGLMTGRTWRTKRGSIVSERASNRAKLSLRSLHRIGTSLATAVDHFKRVLSNSGPHLLSRIDRREALQEFQAEQNRRIALKHLDEIQKDEANTASWNVQGLRHLREAAERAKNFDAVNFSPLKKGPAILSPVNFNARYKRALSNYKLRFSMSHPTPPQAPFYHIKTKVHSSTSQTNSGISGSINDLWDRVENLMRERAKHAGLPPAEAALWAVQEKLRVVQLLGSTLEKLPSSAPRIPPRESEASLVLADIALGLVAKVEEANANRYHPRVRITLPDSRGGSPGGYRSNMLYPSSKNSSPSKPLKQTKSGGGFSSGANSPANDRSQTPRRGGGGEVVLPGGGVFNVKDANATSGGIELETHLSNLLDLSLNGAGTSSSNLAATAVSKGFRDLLSGEDLSGSVTHGDDSSDPHLGLVSDFNFNSQKKKESKITVFPIQKSSQLYMHRLLHVPSPNTYLANPLLLCERVFPLVAALSVSAPPVGEVLERRDAIRVQLETLKTARPAQWASLVTPSAEASNPGSSLSLELTATLRGSESLKTVKNIALNSSSMMDVQLAEHKRRRKVVEMANSAFYSHLNDKMNQTKQNLPDPIKSKLKNIRPSSAVLSRGHSAISISNRRKSDEDEIANYLQKRSRPDSAILAKFKPLDPLSYSGQALSTREDVTTALVRKEAIRYSQRIFSRLSTEELVAADMFSKPLHGIATVHTATKKLDNLKKEKHEQHQREIQAALLVRPPTPYEKSVHLTQIKEEHLKKPLGISLIEKRQDAEWRALEKVSSSAGGLGRFGSEFAAYVQDGARLEERDKNYSGQSRSKTKLRIH